MPIEHLPERMKPPAYRVRDWCMNLGPLLLMLGVAGLARGIAYLPRITPPITRPPHPVENVLSMTTWGWVWVAAALFALAAMAAPYLLAPAAVGLMIGLNGAWALSYFLDAALGGHALNLVPAAQHGALAGISLWAVWKGTREPKVTREEVAHELRRA